MRIAVAGAGAFGEKHLDGLQKIDGVKITSVISRRAEQAAEVAKKYGAKHSSTELDTNANACGASHRLYECRQTRAGGNSTRR